MPNCPIDGIATDIREIRAAASAAQSAINGGSWKRSANRVVLKGLESIFNAPKHRHGLIWFQECTLTFDDNTDRKADI